MEYIIILALIIFLILLIFIKQIIYAKTIYLELNKKSDIKSYIHNKYFFIEYNPINLWLIQNMYESLKPIKKYDFKSYIIFSNLDINPKDKFCLDWYSLIFGLNNLFYDSIINICKKYKHSYFNKLNSINTMYISLFIKILENLIIKKINKNKIILNVNKNIKKHVNKHISKLKIIYHIFYLNELFKIILKDSPFIRLKEYYKIHKNNKNLIPNQALYNAGKLINNIKSTNIKSKNYNSIINNRINTIYLSNDKHILEPFLLNLTK